MANDTKTNETPKRVPAITTEILLGGSDSKPIGVRFASPALNVQRDVLLVSITGEAADMLPVHGLKQKVIDAAAISRNATTGKTADPADKWNAAVAVMERLLSGAWNEEREGGGADSYLFQALVKLYPSKPADAIREWVKGLEPAQRKALEVNPKVAAIISEMKAAKAKDIDSEALLGALDDIA